MKTRSKWVFGGILLVIVVVVCWLGQNTTPQLVDIAGDKNILMPFHVYFWTEKDGMSQSVLLEKGETKRILYPQPDDPFGVYLGKWKNKQIYADVSNIMTEQNDKNMILQYGVVQQKRFSRTYYPIFVETQLQPLSDTIDNLFLEYGNMVLLQDRLYLATAMHHTCKGVGGIYAIDMESLRADNQAKAEQLVAVDIDAENQILGMTNVDNNLLLFRKSGTNMIVELYSTDGVLRYSITIEVREKVDKITTKQARWENGTGIAVYCRDVICNREENGNIGGYMERIQNIGLWVTDDEITVPFPKIAENIQIYMPYENQLLIWKQENNLEVWQSGQTTPCYKGILQTEKSETNYILDAQIKGDLA